MDLDSADLIANVPGLTTPSDKRIRVFYLSYHAPVPTWGTAMSFYRHFVERDDFEIFVATDSAEVEQYDVPYRFLRFDVPKWLKRMQHTRFYRWFWQYNQSIAGYFVPQQVCQAARTFKPDIIFTIGGSWNWTARLAQRVARCVDVPLVASFNDWFDFGVLMHPCFRRSIERAFRKFYRDCDLTFCTLKECSRHLAHIPMRMYCIRSVEAWMTTSGNSLRSSPIRGQQPSSLQARFHFGMDRCSSDLCKQAPTLRCGFKFLAATPMPVGAASLRALHEQPVCTEARYLSIGLRLMLKKPICCCYPWVLVMSAPKPSEPASRQSFLIISRSKSQLSSGGRGTVPLFVLLANLMRRNVILRLTQQVVLLLFRLWPTAGNVRNSLSQMHAVCITVDSNRAESMPCYFRSARS